MAFPDDILKFSTTRQGVNFRETAHRVFARIRCHDIGITLTSFRIADIVSGKTGANSLILVVDCENIRAHDFLIKNPGDSLNRKEFHTLRRPILIGDQIARFIPHILANSRTDCLTMLQNFQGKAFHEPVRFPTTGGRSTIHKLTIIHRPGA
ncbi:MAG: hypothetical protein LRY36_00765 [Alphaproteobacteria bacterium]|nr:hypothetical protein [Alphaproteobacteria bacterium]